MKIFYILLTFCILTTIPYKNILATESADDHILSSDIISEFPHGFRISTDTKSNNNISSIAINLKIGQRNRGVYQYMCAYTNESYDKWNCNPLVSDKQIKSELFWRTNTRDKYIPPGTNIRYSFQIKTTDGNIIDTSQKNFIYHDNRFKWEKVSNNQITVWYHGPVKARADQLLLAGNQTLDNMQPLLNVTLEQPITTTMYNNVKEMLDALPPKSSTISRELITEGQAFTDDGTILVLGNGQNARGTMSHELTHILNHIAGDSIIRPIPSWLDEGLAEYGNIEPGFSYDIALDYAINTNRLKPVVLMKNMPGKSEEIIIFYGQSRSIVNMLINDLGQEKLKVFMSELKSGTSIDLALSKIYNLNSIELYNKWLTKVGAPPYVPPSQSRSIPTAIPIPTVEPYELGKTIKNTKPLDEKNQNESNIEPIASSKDGAILASSNNLILVGIIIFITLLAVPIILIQRKS